MPLKTSKQMRKTTSVSFKKINGTPSFVHIRPMRDKLTAEEFDRIVIEAGGRELTPAEKRKYAKFLKR